MRQIPLRLGFAERLPTWFRAPLHDRYLWAMLIIALFVNLGLFTFLILLSSQLPPLVPLHFDAAGQPDRIEPKDSVFSLPQIGLILIVVNIAIGTPFYRREPLAAYLLGGMSIAVQLLLWVAAISIVRVVIA